MLFIFECLNFSFCKRFGSLFHTCTHFITNQKKTYWCVRYDCSLFSHQRRFAASKNLLLLKADQKMIARAMGHSELVHNRDYVKVIQVYLYINLACLSVCLSVCLYPINFKTAEPIGPKFFVGTCMTPGKVYGWKFASIKIWFLKMLKIHDFIMKSAKFLVFALLMRRTLILFLKKQNFMFTKEIKD